jgi:hypothetical protein
MSDKTYIVRLKAPRFPLHLVRTASAEIQGDHLVFLSSEGKLAALFLMEDVESWNEVAS